jgi:hypothetical protein|nr:hypothetical protein [uncultured Alistipes sp.]
MFPLYTIGLLGSHPATTDTVEYFKFALQYYCGSMSAFRLLVAVSAPDDLMFCHALLELKKTIPGLQLTMVLAEQYRQEHDTALLYGQIRKKADSIVELSVPIYAYFIERCDFIIFNKRTAGASIAARFQKALVGIPIPVQHELCDPGFFVLCTPYPIERKEYLNPDSRHYDPYAELRQSIEYIQRHKFKVKTSRLPQVFLRQWLTPPPRKAYLLLRESGYMQELYQQRDTAQNNYLAAKIFVYTLTARNTHWMLGTQRPDGETLLLQFLQFRHLLDLEAYRRERNLTLKPADLFRPEAYEIGIQESK